MTANNLVSSAKLIGWLWLIFIYHISLAKNKNSSGLCTGPVEVHFLWYIYYLELVPLTTTCWVLYVDQKNCWFSIQGSHKCHKLVLMLYIKDIHLIFILVTLMCRNTNNSSCMYVFGHFTGFKHQRRIKHNRYGQLY